MPLIKSKSKAAFKSNVKAEISAGKPKNQSLAIAYRIQRRAPRKAGGGPAAPPFYARAEAHNLEHAGMIHSPVAGRTDKIPMGVRSGSYVVPADIVSALGQGNSSAGANGLNKLLKMGPYGAAASGAPRAATPKMAAPPKTQKLFAGGGDVGGGPVDIVAAGGEFVVPDHKVSEIGGGSIDHGHDILDKMVEHVRKKNIKTLRKLPKPKKN